MTGVGVAWTLLVWSIVVGSLALALLVLMLTVLAGSRLGSFLYRRCDCHQRLSRLLRRL